MTRKTVYIAGPMKGKPNLNCEAFHNAAAELRAKGWLPIDPTYYNAIFGREPTGKLLRACMDAELAAIPHLDAIYLLRGWERSEGARAELAVALANKLIVIVEGNENGAEVAQ